MDTLDVLVVDDEAGMRYSVVRALRPLRLRLPEVDSDIAFELDTAESGEAALARIAQRPPDLMLLDYKMHGISGVEVLDALRQREQSVLTIMITAFATIETAVRATKSGAFDFIAKPFTPDELRETVRKAAAHLVLERQARRLAREKRRVRFEFISVLGHELKSPLSAIESYLNLMQERTSGDSLASYAQMIDRCLTRAAGMRKLIEDLLDLTRLESGEKARELADVDVQELAQAALEGVRPKADARGISLALTVGAPTMLHADRGEIEIILNNLVSNAVKYNRDGGRVEVQLAGDEAVLKLIVTDTGIGLSEDEAGRLFQDFVRIRNDKTRDIPGSGLGLSIVRKIAELYDGSAAVRSVPDAGSTFTVVLARRTAAAERGIDHAGRTV